MSLGKVRTGHAPGHSGHSIQTGELSRARGAKQNLVPQWCPRPCPAQSSPATPANRQALRVCAAQNTRSTGHEEGQAFQGALGIKAVSVAILRAL